MSLCIGLVHSRVCDPLWLRCKREASPGDRFCARHREALEGALLGYYYVFESRHAEKEQRDKAISARIRLRRKRKAARRKARASHTEARARQKAPQQTPRKAAPAKIGAVASSPRLPEYATAPDTRAYR
jgi:hypothetical protein